MVARRRQSSPHRLAGTSGPVSLLAARVTAWNTTARMLIRLQRIQEFQQVVLFSSRPQADFRPGSPVRSSTCSPPRRPKRPGPPGQWSGSGRRRIHRCSGDALPTGTRIPVASRRGALERRAWPSSRAGPPSARGRCACATRCGKFGSSEAVGQGVDAVVGAHGEGAMEAEGAGNMSQFPAAVHLVTDETTGPMPRMPAALQHGGELWPGREGRLVGDIGEQAAFLVGGQVQRSVDQALLATGS